MTDPVPSKDLVTADTVNDMISSCKRQESYYAGQDNTWFRNVRLVCEELQRLRINAAVDERLDRVERELLEFAPPADPGPSEADHPKNDWQCAACAWMNFGSRTSCGHCEMSRAAQPPPAEHVAGDICERLARLLGDVLRIHGVDISDQVEDLIRFYRNGGDTNTIRATISGR
jgi:hypothetical protein